MSHDDQRVTSSNLPADLTFNRHSQLSAKSNTNSWTHVNTLPYSAHVWPFRGILAPGTDPVLPPATPLLSRAPKNNIEVILASAERINEFRKTMTASDGSALSKKRMSSLGEFQRVDEPQSKQRKTVKPDALLKTGHAVSNRTTTRISEPPSSTTLSAKTMSKLNAFRFSVPQLGDGEIETPNLTQKPSLNHQQGQDEERFTRTSRYNMRDHSSRSIQTVREEMVKQQKAEPAKVQEEALPHITTKKQDNLRPQSKYKIRDHSSRLIQAGIEEMQKVQVSNIGSSNDNTSAFAATPFTQHKPRQDWGSLVEGGAEETAAPSKQANGAVLTDTDYFEVMRVDAADMAHDTDDFDDLDDSIFDDPSLEGPAFEGGTPTDTSEPTELDDLDDSMFEQFIADDDANYEAPSSAQPEIEYFSSDTVSPPSRPGLMLPPKLPTSISAPANAPNANSVKAAPSKTPIQPFIRSPGAALVTSPSPIPAVQAASRLVTCFRLAEMFRELSSTSPPATIELFATVVASVRNREKTSQSFTFADLFFPQRPPYVHGIYGRCSESELFDDDSRPFLRAGQDEKCILARVIVTPKCKSGRQMLWNAKNGFHASEQTSSVIEVEVLSIYVCSWEDLKYTKGIVMPEKEAVIKKEAE
jgi:hypothetical protein